MRGVLFKKNGIAFAIPFTVDTLVSTGCPDTIHFYFVIVAPSPRLGGDPSRIVFSQKEIKTLRSLDRLTLVYYSPNTKVFAVDEDVKYRSQRMVAQVGG